MGIRRGRNRGREQQLLQNRDSLTRRPTAETAGAHGVMLDLHPHQFGFSLHKRPSIHLCDIVSGSSRCYWRLVGVEIKKGGLSSIGVRSGQLALSVHTRLCLDNEQQREREKDRRWKRNIRVGKKKRERDGLCQCLLRA